MKIRDEDETAIKTVEKLTDEAITKRVAQIDRLVKVRNTRLFDTQTEIDELTDERALLVQQQIERLKAQLPFLPEELRTEEK